MRYDFRYTQRALAGHPSMTVANDPRGAVQRSVRTELWGSESRPVLDVRAAARVEPKGDEPGLAIEVIQRYSIGHKGLVYGATSLGRLDLLEGARSTSLLEKNLPTEAVFAALLARDWRSDRVLALMDTIQRPQILRAKEGGPGSDEMTPAHVDGVAKSAQRVLDLLVLTPMLARTAQEALPVLAAFEAAELPNGTRFIGKSAQELKVSSGLRYNDQVEIGLPLPGGEFSRARMDLKPWSPATPAALAVDERTLSGNPAAWHRYPKSYMMHPRMVDTPADLAGALRAAWGHVQEVSAERQAQLAAKDRGGR